MQTKREKAPGFLMWGIVWGIAILGMAYVGGILGFVEYPGLIKTYLIPNPVALKWFLILTLPLTPALGNGFIALFAGVFNGTRPGKIFINQMRNLVILGGAVELADLSRQVISSLTQRVFTNLVVLGVSTNIITFLEGLQIKQPLWKPVPRWLNNVALWGLIPIMVGGFLLNIVSIFISNAYAESLNIVLWAVLPSTYNVLTQFLVGVVRARRSVQAMKLVKSLYEQNNDRDVIRAEILRRVTNSGRQAFALNTLARFQETGAWDMEIVDWRRYAVAHMFRNMGFPIVFSIISGAISGWALALYSASANYESLPVEIAKQLGTNIVLRGWSYPISGVGVLLSVGLGAWLLKRPWVLRMGMKVRSAGVSVRRWFNITLRETAVVLRELVVGNIEAAQYQRHLALLQREEALQKLNEELVHREVVTKEREKALVRREAVTKEREEELARREAAALQQVQIALNMLQKPEG